MRRWAQSRLRTRIFLAFSALLLAALIATLGFTQWVVSREAQRTLSRELLTTGEVFERLVKERAARLESNSALLASDFALKRVLATHFDPATYDPETLASAALSYQERIGAELLWIADDTGKLLVNLPKTAPDHRLLISYSPIEAALETGESSSAIAAVDGTLFQLVAVPVQAPDVIGFLVLGQAIDDRLRGGTQESHGLGCVFPDDGPRIRKLMAAERPRPVRAAAGGLAGDPGGTHIRGDDAPDAVRRAVPVAGLRRRGPAHPAALRPGAGIV